jgi:hypothetical protein
MTRRAGSFAREQAKEKEKRVRRENRGRLAAMSLVPIALAGMAFLIWPAAGVPLWTVPLFLWATLMGAGSSQLFGTYGLEAGADAEVRTSKALAKLKTDGAEVFDHVEFDGYDVDHVLVHPSGVFVIETKYTDRPVDLSGRTTEGMLGDWASCAHRRARKIESLLKLANRFVVDITPIVVVWGTDIAGRDRVVDGVLITRGGALFVNIRDRAVLPRLDVDKQERICAAVQGFIDMRDAHQLVS